MTLAEAIQIVADHVRAGGVGQNPDLPDATAIQAVREEITLTDVDRTINHATIAEAYRVVLSASDDQLAQAFRNAAAEPAELDVTYTTPVVPFGDLDDYNPGKHLGSVQDNIDYLLGTYLLSQVRAITTETGVAFEVAGPAHHVEQLAALYGQAVDGTDPPALATPTYQRPHPADICRGGRYGQHVLPGRADDMRVEQLVQVIFQPEPMFPGWPCSEPLDPQLVQQLLDYAPQTDKTGIDDWNRSLRADEIAAIYGETMEGDPLDVRINWLRRADELCRAWGVPLAGAGGLVPDMTLPAPAEEG